MPSLSLPIAAVAPPPSQTARAFFAWLLSVLPRALAVEAIAWIVCFALLSGMLRTLRPRMKPGLMRLDDSVRAWAKTLRYRAQHPDASPETASRAAQIELQAQQSARELDPDAAPGPEMSSTSGVPTIEQNAVALVASIARDRAFNRPLMSDSSTGNGAGSNGDGGGASDLDVNNDGVVSQAERIVAELSEDEGGERVPRTIFFRFWTNFASAPCLSVMSLAVPLVAAHRAGGVSRGALWLSRAFPGSFWARALAQNIAPPGLAFVAAAGLSAPALAAARVWTMPGLCYTGAMFLSFWLKRVFKRLRPQRRPGAFGHKLQDGSFPSGHSLTSFCFWAALTVAAATGGAGLGRTILLGLSATTIVSLTGLSRVYMGVHFPTDVLGGYFIGLVWCLLSLPALRWALHL